MEVSKESQNFELFLIILYKMHQQAKNILHIDF